MFVTSDIFDLKKIARGRPTPFDWSENLMCGVAVHGALWPGHEAGAVFLLEAAKRLGLFDSMQYANYGFAETARGGMIKPKSFERLARGELSGAKGALDLLLKGLRPTSGSRNGTVLVGGEVSGTNQADYHKDGAYKVTRVLPRSLLAYFIFPLNERPIEAVCELFELAVNLLKAEYGYYYVRDEFCLPGGYPCGIAPSLDHRGLEEEIGGWADFYDEKLWSGRSPLLRDLFQVNLLSERHAATPIEGLGYLTEWISAEPRRGRLDDIGRGRLLWTLTDAEMFNVRPILNEAGLLFSCRDRVYRDLPGGIAPSARP
jgi:hypothetical protein